jgi:hypothetical protein
MVSSDVQIMGAADDVQIYPITAPTSDVEIMGFGASSPADVVCAEQVKGSIFVAAGCTVGAVGTGLFGVYKLFKGKPAAGVTSLVATALVFGLGRVLAQSAATRFTACQAAHAAPTAP